MIRTIRPGDYDRVGPLLVAAYRGAGPFADEYLDYLSRPQRWVPTATTVLVAEVGGEVVGVVALTRPGDETFEDALVGVADCGMRFLAVDPHARGSGAGRALVRACVDAARRGGCRRMVLHSMWFMTAAHRLYEQEGFVRRPDLDVRFSTGVGYAFHLDLTRDAADHFPPPGSVPEEPPWFEDAWQG